MLIEFSFENFKCYKNQTTLRMEAASLDEHAETLIHSLGGKELLPIAAIYGPNGGGKSSVLQALLCLRNLVTTPYFIMRGGLQASRNTPCKPYAFDKDAKKEPTTFCIIFESGDHMYRYILATKNNKIEEEYLHRRKSGRGAQATIFERVGQSISLGSSLKKRRVNTDVDSAMPYLTFLAINYEIDSVDDAFSWFLSCSFLDYSQAASEDYFKEPENENDKKMLISALNAMDIDITDIRYLHEGNDYTRILLQHSAGEGGELELHEESNGTRKLINVIPSFITALREGTLVISDELDSKLHPKLLKYLIKLFTDKKSNPHGAQLIFTSHDMSTLNSKTFRRDEIWFAARAEDGSSSLYSLADIADIDGQRVRTTNAYDRQYLAGRYGADPYLYSMLDWSANE